jgi:hypothetical protein
VLVAASETFDGGVRSFHAFLVLGGGFFVHTGFGDVGRATGAEEDGVGVAPCFERLEFFSRWQGEILSEFSFRGLVLHL